VTKQIRLHLRLSESLSNNWELQALKLGMTKSKLLNTWLGSPIQDLSVIPQQHRASETLNSNSSTNSKPELLANNLTLSDSISQTAASTQKLTNTSHISLKQISIRLSADHAALINELATSWNLSINQLLERIIYTNTSRATKLKPIIALTDQAQLQIAEQIETLWLQGKNNQILEQFAHNSDLSIDNQVELSRISMQQNDLGTAIHLIDKAEDKLIAKDLNCENLYAELNLVRAQWWRRKFEYKIANKTLENLLHTHQNLSIDQYSQVQHQLSTLNEIMGDFSLAAKFTWQAMENIQVSTHKRNYVKSYLRLACLLTADSADLARQFLFRAEELSIKHDLGVSMQVYLLNRKGLTLLRLAEVNSALIYFKQAYHISRQYDLKVELCYSIEGMLACSSSTEVLQIAQSAFKRDFAHRTKLQRLIGIRTSANFKPPTQSFSLPLNIRDQVHRYNLIYKTQAIAI